APCVLHSRELYSGTIEHTAAYGTRLVLHSQHFEDALGRQHRPKQNTDLRATTHSSLGWHSNRVPGLHRTYGVVRSSRRHPIPSVSGVLSRESGDYGYERIDGSEETFEARKGLSSRGSREVVCLA